jgi:hypothetical protein
MATRRKPDNCEFLNDGQVKLTFGGAPRTLGRPKIGQLKMFNNKLMQIAAEQAASRESGADIDVDEAVSATLEWWSDVINELKDDDDLPVPSDLDDFPTWMMNGELIAKIQTHWREVPWASGGN